MIKPLWIILALAGISLALLIAYLAGGPTAPGMAGATPADQVVQPKVATPATSTQRKFPAPDSSPTGEAPTPLPPDEQAAALAQGELISSLFEKASEGGKENIETVYTALNHGEREVREAAVDVVIQFIGRDGIPRLRAALASAPTKEDKQQIEEAIEFLELPTLGEARGEADAGELKKRRQTQP